MPCIVPFETGSADLCFFALRPTGVFPEELIHALKCFSFFAEDMGCLYSSVFQSVHGSLVIWYGAWVKRSPESYTALRSQLITAMRSLSNLAVLQDFGFFDPCAGQAKDGRAYTRFRTGDTISVSGMVPLSVDRTPDLLYACLAILKSTVLTADGLAGAVLFSCRDTPLVATLHVWESREACYTWLFHGTGNFRTGVLPYVNHLTNDSEYDVLRVCYVSTDDVVEIQFLPPPRAIQSSETTEDPEGVDLAAAKEEPVARASRSTLSSYK